ncbi:DUF1569 domain-containing protein [Pedobacter sp. HMF7647]|uniref:DUF1569 domain-containing protein n=1 Tax=Hufsiella arboris TaxID=2695275 RepID=A0A7K1YCR8_9SPHI|nr:DUF1569 domain-containing protein [Hufsiella arboris]MXV52377.1 DUF1569 domain-containing protein [Hufsiella arboris]
MKSIYNPADNADMINRIQNLTIDSQALWGKMNVSQMLAHCQQPVKVSFGELNLKGGLLGFLFGKMAKKKLMSDQPLSKGLPTVKQFVIKHTPDFETEKQELIKQVSRYSNGQDQITKLPHPFFGKLTLEEWDKLQWKHLDHHLRQFGS